MGEDTLKGLGERLRQARIEREEVQQLFAARIGVSRPTLSKMEAGDPGVSIGSWVRAFRLLGRTGELERLLSDEDDLFLKYEREHSPKRRRASARRT